VGHARRPVVRCEGRGLFINMDRMIGTDFEAGLANLKALVEKVEEV
jgi:hypothetical protein